MRHGGLALLVEDDPDVNASGGGRLQRIGGPRAGSFARVEVIDGHFDRPLRFVDEPREPVGHVLGGLLAVLEELRLDPAQA